MAAETRHKGEEITAIRRADGESRTLAASLPRLVLEARRIAANVIHGLHGRRRSGAGESFWQYRRFVSGEPSQNVDWRRSARDDHLYVREQEWEAAHTVWLWPDRSPSMAFASRATRDSKLERGLIVTFALAELLVAGGERVGIPGLMNAPVIGKLVSNTFMKKDRTELIVFIKPQIIRDAQDAASVANGMRSRMFHQTDN